MFRFAIILLLMMISACDNVRNKKECQNLRLYAESKKNIKALKDWAKATIVDDGIRNDAKSLDYLDINDLKINYDWTKLGIPLGSIILRFENTNKGHAELSEKNVKSLVIAHYYADYLVVPLADMEVLANEKVKDTDKRIIDIKPNIKLYCLKVR